MPNNSTNGSAAAGPAGKPGGGPLLPDAAPDSVQSLLDGLFSWGGEMGKGIGDFVSGLADAIGSGDAAGILLEVVVTLL